MVVFLESRTKRKPTIQEDVTTTVIQYSYLKIILDYLDKLYGKTVTLLCYFSKTRKTLITFTLITALTYHSKNFEIFANKSGKQNTLL